MRNEYSKSRSSGLDKKKSSVVLKKSKFREIEERLRTQILRNPTKPIDYTIVRQLNEEAAKTI